MSEEKIEKGEQTPILNEKIYNQHNWWTVSLVIVTFWLFVCVIGFNALLFTRKCRYCFGICFSPTFLSLIYFFSFLNK